MYMPTPPIEIFGCANNSSDVAISLPVLISYALLVGIPSKLSMGGYQAVAKDTAAGILVAARTCHILGRIKWQTTREARKLKTRWACARLPAQRIRGAKLCKGLGGGIGPEMGGGEFGFRRLFGCLLLLPELSHSLAGCRPKLCQSIQIKISIKEVNLCVPKVY